MEESFAERTAEGELEENTGSFSYVIDMSVNLLTLSLCHTSVRLLCLSYNCEMKKGCFTLLTNYEGMNELCLSATFRINGPHRHHHVTFSALCPIQGSGLRVRYPSGFQGPQNVSRSVHFPNFRNKKFTITHPAPSVGR